MPEPIKLKPHLTTDQLYKRYRDCRHHQEKLRWRALYLISSGQQAAQAARRVGRSSAWMTKLARRYNQKGPQAVPNQRGESVGRKPRLSKQVALELDKALQGPAPDGGLWTAPKVVTWIKDKTGASVNKTTAWRWIRRLGFTLQMPRPTHRKKAGPSEQEAFKKSWLKQLPA
jgi:transposase